MTRGIIGYLAVHLLNEYGGLIAKILENSTFAKIAGYLFKQLREFVLLFIPIDVINDYHQLLISFLDGLAPPEMVENVRQFSGKDDINFLFEGAQMALENLGIDFSELKDNVWEEIRREREFYSTQDFTATAIITYKSDIERAAQSLGRRRQAIWDLYEEYRKLGD